MLIGFLHVQTEGAGSQTAHALSNLQLGPEPVQHEDREQTEVDQPTLHSQTNDANGIPPPGVAQNPPWCIVEVST